MPLLSEINFGAFLVYSPSGQSDLSKSSRGICHSVKKDGYITNASPPVKAIPYSVKRLSETLDQSELAGLFRRRPLLVPAPRSSWLHPDDLSPPVLICKSMVSGGLATDVAELLRRTKAVPKAAFQKAANRPTAQTHYDSIAVNNALVTAESILVVDDIVTSGGMLLACVSRLRETYPNIKVNGFALIRTISGEEIDVIIKPCVGMITLNGDRGKRIP